MFEKAIEIIMQEPPELHYHAHYADLLRAKSSEIPNSSDLISRQAAIDMCRKPHMRNADCSDFEMEIMMLPPAQPETCKGCKHLGKWENEVECGCPSPCTLCKRRAEDWYER